MIKNIAIIGMGALGILYADQITEKMGYDSVTFVMNEERLKKYSRMAVGINGKIKSFKMEDEKKVKPYDLIIVAVKYNSLPSALETMKNCVGKDTIIISVMNGITSEEIIAERYGREHMLNVVAQGMDAMRDGTSVTFSRAGELHIGAIDDGQKKNLEKVAELFETAGVPYVIEKDIKYRMWCKFMLNIGINQVCLAFETDYQGALKEGGKARETLELAMQEVVKIAQKENIGLTYDDINDDIAILETLCPTAYPSMRQDGVAHRPSEVEMFAGVIIKLGKKYGIEVPANQLLYDRIKELEKNY